MRRSAIILLMFLLPFQWIWAAAATLCDHEAGGSHFGHHEHKHTASPGKVSTDDAVHLESGGTHPDCQACHGVVGAYAPAASAGSVQRAPERLLTHYGRHIAEPPTEDLLRPPLSVVA